MIQKRIYSTILTKNVQSAGRFLYTLQSMKALILETSTEKSCLLLASSNGEFKTHLLSGGPELSKTLGLEAKKLLSSSTRPIDKIFVGQGPGSYTGTRVGAALGKGLSFGWNIPLYGFCSLKAFTPNQTGPFAVVVDAKMGGFYVLLGENSSYEAPELVNEDSLKKLLQNIQTIVSPHPCLIQSRLPYLHVLEAHLNFEFLESLAFSPLFEAPLELTYLERK